jgi:hypothetical protein
MEAMENCPRFKFCSANRCPLDSDIDLRNEIKGEEKCGMAKSIRLRIGKEFNLEKMGLTEREWSARKRYENLSPEDKEKLVRRGSLALKKLNCSSSHE